MKGSHFTRRNGHTVPKIGYRTAAQARAASNVNGRRMQVYPCSFCPRWHVGTPDIVRRHEDRRRFLNDFDEETMIVELGLRAAMNLKHENAGDGARREKMLRGRGRRVRG